MLNTSDIGTIRDKLLIAYTICLQIELHEGLYISISVLLGQWGIISGWELFEHRALTFIIFTVNIVTSNHKCSFSVL